MRRRVVFVAPRAWPAVGGMEAYLRHLTAALAGDDDVLVLAQGVDGGPRGRLADTLAPPPAFAPFEVDGVRVEPLRLPPARRALLAPLAAYSTPGLRRLAYGRTRPAAAALYSSVVAASIAARARGAAVVHMWGGGLLAGAALRAARQLGAAFVETPFAHEGRWGDDAASAAVYRRADRILALLEVEAALYRKLGVPAGRIGVCGVCTPGAAGGDGDAVRRAHGIDGPLVLFLGVRRPYKGYDLLLEAAPAVAERRSDVTFAFVGPGAGTPAAAGVRCVDAGEVDDAARADWLAAADVLCLPSESEILPVSILEAWSAGTPVVASDIPPLRELVEGSGGGWVAAREPEALATVLGRALGDPAGLRAAGARGRAAWRERYSVEAVAALHRRVYDALAPGEATCAA